MLPKTRRIDKSFFSTAKSAVKTVRGEFFTMRIFKNTSPITRFAVSISKKIEKKAVSRNAIRRISYRAIASKINEVPNNNLIHFILNLKPKNIKSDITIDIYNLISNI